MVLQCHGKVQWHGNDLAMTWQRRGNDMAWHGNDMAMTWQRHGNDMAISWHDIAL
jgi:hypothetical protein